jgi:hypothetical protein
MTPINTKIPPRIWIPIKVSPKRNSATTEAPTGSNKPKMAAFFESRYLNAMK